MRARPDDVGLFTSARATGGEGLGERLDDVAAAVWTGADPRSWGPRGSTPEASRPLPRAFGSREATPEHLQAGSCFFFSVK